MPTSHFLKSQLNIILLSTPGSFKFSLSLRSSGGGWENGIQYGGYLRIYWISSRGQPTRERTPSWVLREVLKTPRRKNWPCYGTHTCMCLGYGLTVACRVRTSFYMIRQKIHASVDSKFYAPLDAGVYKSTALILANIITRGCCGAPPCLCVTKRLQQQVRPNCHSMHRLRHSTDSLYVRSSKLLNPLKNSGNNMHPLFWCKKFSISTTHCECMYFIWFTVNIEEL